MFPTLVVSQPTTTTLYAMGQNLVWLGLFLFGLISQLTSRVHGKSWLYWPVTQYAVVVKHGDAVIDPML